MSIDDKISHISNQENDHLFKSNLYDNHSNDEDEDGLQQLNIIQGNKAISENNVLKLDQENLNVDKEVFQRKPSKENIGNNNSGTKKSVDEEYRITIQTQQNQNVIDRVMESKIIRSEQKGGGIFSLGRTYTVYLIQTQTQNWEVERRFKDFQWLRSLLQK